MTPTRFDGLNFYLVYMLCGLTSLLVIAIAALICLASIPRDLE